MKDASDQNNVLVADQSLATPDEWTGNYAIAGEAEARGGTWSYKIQPGRHEPWREVGWQVRMKEYPHDEVSVVEAKIEGEGRGSVSGEVWR